MNSISRLFPVAFVLLWGCASAPTARLNADYPDDRAQIQRRLHEIFDAAEKKDFARLEGYHFYGPKFTKYAPEAPGKLDAAAARQGERNGLARVSDLSMNADDLQIDVFGDFAIATFRMSYSFKTGADTITNGSLSTLVFVKDRGSWKITHEHFSAVVPSR